MKTYNHKPSRIEVANKKSGAPKAHFIDNRASNTKQQSLINASAQALNPVAQMQFIDDGIRSQISGNYNSAAQYWAQAATRVNTFCDGYDETGFENSHMEKNMLSKSVKAATTCAGESFEVHQWGAVDDPNEYMGPGGTEGVDLKIFKNRNVDGKRAYSLQGTDNAEVKSSEDLYWRNLFYGVPEDVNRIAYLGGVALDAALGRRDDEGKYLVYNKDNFVESFRCN